jgi:hypothetical protein
MPGNPRHSCGLPGTFFVYRMENRQRRMQVARSPIENRAVETITLVC